MIYFRGFLLVMVLVGFSQCASVSSKTVDATWGEKVVVAYGETLNLPEGLGTVTFDQLVYDNRCPFDAQCITQGSAKVAFSHVPTAGSKMTLEFVIGDNPEQVHEFDAYRVRLVSLSPLPRTGQRPDPVKYELELQVEQK